MKFHYRAALALGFVLSAQTALLAAPAAAQQNYPERPVRVVVPYPPGGNLDITTRTITAAMARHLKQSMVVENLGGAGGSIGAGTVARSAPDGYTVLSTTIVPLVVNPVLMPGTQVKLDDFEPVGMLAVVPSVLEVNAKNSQGIADFKGFIENARKDPGAVALSHSGNGTTNHIAALLIERDFDVSFNAIPYRGSAPALADLLGNQVDAMIDQLNSSLPQIKSGGLKALAVTSAERVPALPDVPTVAELGKPGFEMVTYSALMTPKGTPLAVRQALNEALAKAVADPEVRRQLESTGAQVVPATIEQAGQLFEREQAKLRPLLDAGVFDPR
ncbi:tripartite tricarboxylate transporter substrate binding protein [Orrella sp. JC864]|uniref:tripartite tricarboxylate transporter substrate binding protein n=1 Tax=Orrella sp. JC864 TaxID=3120298 RepID=UPI003009148E